MHRSNASLTVALLICMAAATMAVAFMNGRTERLKITALVLTIGGAAVLVGWLFANRRSR